MERLDALLVFHGLKQKALNELGQIILPRGMGSFGFY